MVKQLGERIRALRKSKGWSQEVLADNSGINQKYISEVERGRVNGSIVTYDCIAKGLKISLADLVDSVESGRSGDELLVLFHRAAELDDKERRLVLEVLRGLFKGME